MRTIGGRADREVQVRAAALGQDREEPVDAVPSPVGRRAGAVGASRGASLLGREEGLEGLLALRAVVGHARLDHAVLDELQQRAVHERSCPAALPVWIAVGIWKVLASRIRPADVRRVAQDLEGRHASRGRRAGAAATGR